MKRIPFFSILALATAIWLLSACSKQSEFEYIDDVVVVPNDKEQPNVTVTDENGNETTLPQGSVIGVYMVDENGNVTLTQVEVGEDGNAVLPASAGGSMIAYSPYQEDWGEDAITTEPVFTVKEDQRSNDAFEACDLIVGTTAGVTRAPSEGGIAFRHMMAKVAIHVVDKTGRVNLSNIGARLLGVYGSVKVNLAKQSVTTMEEDKLVIPMYSELTTDWRISSYAIVPPQSIADGTPFFVITLYGNPQTYPIPEATRLESGKSYTINMRLTEHGLIQDGWYVTDWDEQGEQDIDINL